MKRDINFRTITTLGLLFAFLANIFVPLPTAQAQEFRLPAPGVMVHLSPEFNPPILKGIKVHPDNPFRFDFILDQGDSVIAKSPRQKHSGVNSTTKKSQQEQLKQESIRLIKYFLASLTIPEKDLWVNLSPYEKDRIIPQSFGLTEMGCDLLAEDYMLKQITASLIYPEDAIGKKFWRRIYEEAVKKFGTTNIPMNTFNKVWIVPEKAVMYENAKAGTAYVIESKLKVMLEQDYLALSKGEGPHAGHSQELAISKRTTDSAEIASSPSAPRNDTVNALGSQILRATPATSELSRKSRVSLLAKNILQAIVIPQLTREINEDMNFAQLRQIYNSLILATWYKNKIKDSILKQVYADKNKVAGVNIDDPQEKERIYQKYLRAFRKGVYNYIKEEQDPLTHRLIPRKYFSGGVNFFGQLPMTEVHSFAILKGSKDNAMNISVQMIAEEPARDRAMVNFLFNAYPEDEEKKGYRYKSTDKTAELQLQKDFDSKPNPVLGWKIYKEFRKDFIKAHKDEENAEEYYGRLLDRAVRITSFYHAHGETVINSDLRPYIVHPLETAYHLLRLGYRDKITILSTLFHDVFEKAVKLDDQENQLKRIFEQLNSNEQGMPDQLITKEEFDAITSIVIGRMTNDKFKDLIYHLDFLSNGLDNLSPEESSKIINGMTKKDRKIFTTAVLIKIVGFWQARLTNSWKGNVRSFKMKKDNIARMRKFLKLPVIPEAIRQGINQLLNQEDAAMSTKRVDSVMNGGIDLTSDKVSLQMQNSNGEIKFHIDPAILQQLQNSPGFTPIIINIQPMTNLKMFLGLATKRPNELTQSAMRFQ